MAFIRPLFCLTVSVLFYCLCSCQLFYENDNKYKPPTVGISVLVRNKEYDLPYFLTCLRRLNYPKDRMYLWIYSDYSWDRTDDILQDWLEKYGDEYGAVYITMNTPDTGYEYIDERGTKQWSESHYKHVIELREKALEFGRKMWADYLLMIDADAILTNPDTLHTLIHKDLEISAPMLNSDGYYSNFWCAMNEHYYYKQTEEYHRILKRDITGCIPVAMVHTCVLINLKLIKSDSLTYDPDKAVGYHGPIDDIITFVVNAKNIGMSIHVCNEEFYGYTKIPAADKTDPVAEKQQLLNIKMEAISRGAPLPVDEELEAYVQYQAVENYDLDDIYVINLERRPERRRLMELSLKELGMMYTLFKAIDGRELSQEIMARLGIQVMENYEDPYHKRPMKIGEVGCFLSHYYIWKRVAERENEKVLVLEDDIRFIPNFKENLKRLMDDIKYLIGWDMVYIGRKILHEESEEYETHFTVRPRYSYWTLGYIINARGAQKLLDAKPLKKLIPVDEFLPIMFNQHPNSSWKAHFKNRNLVAYSAAPLLVYPTHYTGEKGYISDTEQSEVHTTPAPEPDIQYDQETMRPITFHIYSIGLGGEDDPLDVENRFSERRNPEDTWDNSWRLKIEL